MGSDGGMHHVESTIEYISAVQLAVQLVKHSWRQTPDVSFASWNWASICASVAPVTTARPPTIVTLPGSGQISLHRSGQLVTHSLTPLAMSSTRSSQISTVHGGTQTVTFAVMAVMLMSSGSKALCDEQLRHVSAYEQLVGEKHSSVPASERGHDGSSE